jgi:hypothetical protein
VVISYRACMMERSWPQELHEFLDARYRALCSALGQTVSPSGLRIAPPFGSDEARYFMLGMEAGIFAVDRNGQIESSLIPVASTGTTEQEEYRMLWCDPPPLSPRLLRDVVTRFSTAAMLILDRGWLQRQIQIEPMIKNDGATAYGVEIVVKSLTGELLAGVVVKRSGHELAKLKSDFNQCCKRGQHPEDNCGFPQNHGKFEFCAMSKPAYFWGVAPDAEICFKMNYAQDGTIRLDEFGSLPPRSIVELATTTEKEGKRDNETARLR